MKKLVFTCAMLACMSVAAIAQNSQVASTPANGAPQMTKEQMMAQREEMGKKQATAMAERETKEMQQKFALSPEQTTKVLAANQEYRTKFMANRNPADHHRVTATEMQALADERDAKLKAIMNADQYTKYDAVKQATMPRTPQLPNAAPTAAPTTK